MQTLAAVPVCPGVAQYCATPGHIGMGAPFVYAPSVYWNIVVFLPSYAESMELLFATTSV